jgi:hypothetical protein
MAQEFDTQRQANFLGDVAVNLADRDPAAAEQALELSKSKSGGLFPGPVYRVAGRMASKDRARARRLADALERPQAKAAALAAMARGLTASDPKAAAALFDEALAALEKLARDGLDRSAATASSTAVALLPLVELLGDPALLERSFWRAIALRPPRPPEGDPHGFYEDAIAKLAIGLARYDRGVARQVLEPVTSRARSVNTRDRAQIAPTQFVAAALIDPDWAAALVDALPDDPPGTAARPKAMAARAVAGALAHGGARWWVYAAMQLPRFDDDRYER